MNLIFLLQNHSDFSFVLLILVALLMIGGGLFGFWTAQWAAKSDNQYRPRIAQWASENGWQLIRSDWKYDPGPFGWLPRRDMPCFRFVVSDPQGKEKIGWARFDNTLFGDGQMNIRWDGK